MKNSIVVTGHFSGTTHGASLMGIRFCSTLESIGYLVIRIDRSLSQNHKDLTKIKLVKIFAACVSIFKALQTRLTTDYNYVISIPAGTTPSILLDIILINILKKNNSILVCYVHGKLTWTKRFSKFVNKYLMQFSVYLATSLEISKNLQFIGIDYKKIKLLYNSLPNGWEITSKPLSGEDPINRILYLSSVSSKKGVWVLLEAYLKLAAIELVILPDLHIAGPEGEYGIYKQIMRWIEVNNMKNKIFIHGTLSRKEVYSYLYNPAIFVFPSCNEEAFGLVLVEAMSLGIPVVASDIGAIPEVLSISGKDNLFSFGDSVQLAKRLIELLNSAEKRETTSIAGINIVRKKFTYQIYSMQVKNIFSEIH